MLHVGAFPQGCVWCLILTSCQRWCKNSYINMLIYKWKISRLWSSRSGLRIIMWQPKKRFQYFWYWFSCEKWMWTQGRVLLVGAGGTPGIQRSVPSVSYCLKNQELWEETGHKEILSRDKCITHQADHIWASLVLSVLKLFDVCRLVGSWFCFSK